MIPTVRLHPISTSSLHRTPTVSLHAQSCYDVTASCWTRVGQNRYGNIRSHRKWRQARLAERQQWRRRGGTSLNRLIISIKGSAHSLGSVKPSRMLRMLFGSFHIRPTRRMCSKKRMAICGQRVSPTSFLNVETVLKYFVESAPTDRSRVNLLIGLIS